MSLDDQEQIVEFKLLLAEMAEAYVLARLSNAARAQGRRLPKEAMNLVRTGALAAVGSLSPDDLLDFARSPDWDASVQDAIDSGAWPRLLQSTVQNAFTPGVA